MFRKAEKNVKRHIFLWNYNFQVDYSCINLMDLIISVSSQWPNPKNLLVPSVQVTLMKNDNLAKFNWSLTVPAKFCRQLPYLKKILGYCSLGRVMVNLTGSIKKYRHFTQADCDLGPWSHMYFFSKPQSLKQFKNYIDFGGNDSSMADCGDTIRR